MPLVSPYATNLPLETSAKRNTLLSLSLPISCTLSVASRSTQVLFLLQASTHLIALLLPMAHDGLPQHRTPADYQNSSSHHPSSTRDLYSSQERTDNCSLAAIPMSSAEAQACWLPLRNHSHALWFPFLLLPIGFWCHLLPGWPTGARAGLF